jgi:two-component system, NarL family, nitrate/nitrite response regulator NarL
MMDAGLIQAALAGREIAGPRVALIVTDPARRRRFASLVDQVPVVDADAILVDLAPGETMPALPHPVLLLTDDPGFLAEPPTAGAVPREATTGQVMAALCAVAQGLLVRATVVQPVHKEQSERRLLTPRERQILLLVGEGQSNKVIARGLGISGHTVKYHLEAIFAKLGARTRAEAISLGLRRGLVSADSLARA